MKFRCMAVVLAGAFLIGAGASGAAPAKQKHWRYYSPEYCRDTTLRLSIGEWLFGIRPKPEWNGCTPPVYTEGEFIGQDPDPNVRATLRRDPDQGYRINN